MFNQLLMNSFCLSCVPHPPMLKFCLLDPIWTLIALIYLLLHYRHTYMLLYWALYLVLCYMRTWMLCVAGPCTETVTILHSTLRQPHQLGWADTAVGQEFNHEVNIIYVMYSSVYHLYCYLLEWSFLWWSLFHVQEGGVTRFWENIVSEKSNIYFQCIF